MPYESPSAEFRPEPQDGFIYERDGICCEYEYYLDSVESSEGWFYGLDIAKEENQSLVDCYDI